MEKNKLSRIFAVNLDKIKIRQFNRQSILDKSKLCKQKTHWL